MYTRKISEFWRQNAKNYPVLAVTGPRQSGKSTFSKGYFKDYAYVSLEDSDVRQLAKEDPRGFFKLHPAPVILDEVQRVPELLSYIQTMVDADPKQRFVLTGSNHLSLVESVTQSLAGRVLLTELLPMSYSELQAAGLSFESVEDLIFKGGYPKIYAENLDGQVWLRQYYRTYVEKDVRSVLNVTDLDQFDRFLRLCAGRAGQLLNLSGLGSDCGISSVTAQKWLSVLKSTYIAFTLPPYFKNFSKRWIKTPKLYFYDTGLLCFLLRMESSRDLQTHPFRGAIFENWVVVELMKSFFNQGRESPLYFWRDQKNREIDVLIDRGQALELYEVKSSYTFSSSFLKDLKYFSSQNDQKLNPLGHVIYAGDKDFDFQDYKIHSWHKWASEL